MAGRTIHKLIKALTDVEQFETIDTSTSTKEWLLRCRETLVNMVRTVNVRDSVTITMDTVSDMAYAWQCITDFIGEMQGRVKRDPGVVVLLRAVFAVAMATRCKYEVRWSARRVRGGRARRCARARRPRARARGRERPSCGGV